MYNTRLKNNRYMMNCITMLNNPQVVEFVVDTGAIFTCCHYQEIDDSLKEDDFKDAPAKLIGGIVAGSAIRLYECPLKQMTVGNLDLRDQSIWITFDDRLSDNVLGMDILKQILFSSFPDDRKLVLFQDRNEALQYLAG